VHDETFEHVLQTRAEGWVHAGTTVRASAAVDRLQT